MTGITGIDRDAGPRGNVGFRIEEHGVDLAGAEHQQLAAVDIDRGPVREDLYWALARIDLERDVRRNDDRIAWHHPWIRIVRGVHRQVVGAAGSIWALDRGPRGGVRIADIGGDLTAGDRGRLNRIRQGTTIGRHPVDAAGREHDGSDANAQPVFPGGAQQNTRGRSRQLEPAKYV